LRLYFDTSYLGKCYWNEPDGRMVRKLAQQADGVYSSAICIAEIACLAHRTIREGPSAPAEAVIPRDWFLDDMNSGAITAVPVTERLLRRVEATIRALPASCCLRTFDALHLVTATDAGPIIDTCSPPHLISDWSAVPFSPIRTDNEALLRRTTDFAAVNDESRSDCREFKEAVNAGGQLAEPKPDLADTPANPWILNTHRSERRQPEAWPARHVTAPFALLAHAWPTSRRGV
jgi:predicted nucleic acid-binding protein